MKSAGRGMCLGTSHAMINLHKNPARRQVRKSRLGRFGAKNVAIIPVVFAKIPDVWGRAATTKASQPRREVRRRVLWVTVASCSPNLPNLPNALSRRLGRLGANVFRNQRDSLRQTSRRLGTCEDLEAPNPPGSSVKTVSTLRCIFRRTFPTYCLEAHCRVRWWR